MKIHKKRPDRALPIKATPYAQQANLFQKLLLNEDTSKTLENVSSNEEKLKELLDHIVQNGETLYRIARKYGVSIEQLIKANPHLVKIKTGQALEIPGLKDLHYVASGDTLYSIVKKYQNQISGLTVNKIIGHNLQPGTKLTIPSSNKTDINPGISKALPSAGYLPVNMQHLLSGGKSAYVRHPVQYGDDLWKIAKLYWSAEVLNLNSAQFNQFIAVIVEDMMEHNNLTPTKDGKVAGFIAGQVPMLYVLVPYQKAKNTPSNPQVKEQSEESGTRVETKQKHKILTDEQSKNIGNFMGKLEAILGLVEICNKHLGKNNKITKFIKNALDIANNVTLKIDLIKGRIDLHDGRYKGKPENLIFDALKLIISTNAYGAIILELINLMDVDADAFFAYCKKHNLSLPSVGENKQLKTKDGIKINYYKFNYSPGKFNNTNIFPFDKN